MKTIEEVFSEINAKIDGAKKEGNLEDLDKYHLRYWSFGWTGREGNAIYMFRRARDSNDAVLVARVLARFRKYQSVLDLCEDYFGGLGFTLQEVMDPSKKGFNKSFPRKDTSLELLTLRTIPKLNA